MFPQRKTPKCLLGRAARWFHQARKEKMEEPATEWRFRRTFDESKSTQPVTVRSVLDLIAGNLNEADQRPLIHLGRGDPSSFPSFRTTPVAEEAVIDAVRSCRFNCYSSAAGILPARRSIAEYISRNLPYNLSPDDIYLTAGANHGIDVLVKSIYFPGANVLLPKPGYPVYESSAAFSNLEVRHFDLLPGKDWEVDLHGVEELADDKTIAIAIINPGNPCGNVFAYQHLQKVVMTAKKLGILVIADEVYGHLCFGSKPFVPMGTFGSIAPVITLGSISKRWIVPGWRLGWIAMTDPNYILKKNGIVEGIERYIEIAADPATIIQGAVPQILEKTSDAFFSKIIDILREDADICYAKLKDTPCFACPPKPEGAMSMMVKLNLACLEDINDDMDFCFKLAKEESVILLPGVTLGLKDWVRITFAVEPTSLRDGLERIEAFCLRHAKKKKNQ